MSWFRCYAWVSCADSMIRLNRSFSCTFRRDIGSFSKSYLKFFWFSSCSSESKWSSSLSRHPQVIAPLLRVSCFLLSILWFWRSWSHWEGKLSRILDSSSFSYHIWDRLLKTMFTWICGVTLLHNYFFDDGSILLLQHIAHDLDFIVDDFFESSELLICQFFLIH